LKTPNKIYDLYIEDISRYMRYFRFDGFNGSCNLQFLPLSRSYDEHPYWLIMKLEIILEIINKVNMEENKKEK